VQRCPSGTWPRNCYSAYDRERHRSGAARRAISPLLKNLRIPWRVISGLICVVLGSALGGIARYFLSGFVARRVGETFPWGTLVVNVSGAVLIGIFGALARDNASLFASSNPWLFAVTGFLGCYTTVSSFSLQTLALAKDGESRRALGYVVISVALSLVAVAAGFALVNLVS
jgi:fluoride exporter